MPYFPHLVHRARALYDQDGLHAELVFLRDTFRQNSYMEQQIHRALSPPPRVAQPDKKPDSVAFLPYIRLIFNRTSSVLSRHNIKSVGLPPKKISSFLRSVKDDLGLKTMGVYSICCEYSQIYIGQMGCSIDTRLKEHQQHIKSAVMEHNINFRHRIHIHHTAILSTEPRYMDRIIREVIEN
jgi:hypothetical protein